MTKKELPSIIQIDGYKIMYIQATGLYKEAGKRYGEKLTFKEAKKRGLLVVGF